MTPDTSLGFEVVEFARDVLEIDLLPWQEWLFVHGLELRADGMYRFRTVLVLVARQQGKTTALMVLALWRLVMDAARMVLGTSTNLDYARESWGKAVELAWGPAQSKVFAGVPQLEGEFLRPRFANGEQTLSTTDGGRYKIATASATGGRSLSVDCLILDELRMHRTWAAWSASSKTTNARPKGQRWALSNMGDDSSVVLNHLRAQALSMIDTGVGDDALGLFEWSAPPGMPAGDRAGWAMANPALGYIVAESTLESDYLTDDAEVFEVEVLCRRVPTLTPLPITVEAWAGRRVVRRKRPPGVPVFGLSVAPSLRSAAVGAAVMVSRNVAHLELPQHKDGVGWLVGRCVQLRDRNPEARFVAVATGAVAGVIPDLLREGIEPELLSAVDLARAYGHLETRIKDRTVTQSGADGFVTALAGAVKRDVGEGLWSLGWRKASSDLTPIEAGAVALWGLRADAVALVGDLMV